MTLTHTLTMLLALNLPLGQSSTARRVGGDISPPHKTQNVYPAYPESLKQAGVQDIVFVDASIDKNGLVVDVTPLRGVPELVETTLAAVRKWRYEPAKLNGEPVEVVITLSVAFFLSGRSRVPVIQAALHDPNEEVRKKTVAYLRFSSVPRADALKLLASAQEDPSPAVREAAAVSIRIIKARKE